jgi:hypothetical protein
MRCAVIMAGAERHHAAPVVRDRVAQVGDDLLKYKTFSGIMWVRNQFFSSILSDAAGCLPAVIIFIAHLARQPVPKTSQPQPQE